MPFVEVLSYIGQSKQIWKEKAPHLWALIPNHSAYKEVSKHMRLVPNTTDGSPGSELYEMSKEGNWDLVGAQNRRRTEKIKLPYQQFQFVSMPTAEEAKSLYDKYDIPGGKLREFKDADGKVRACATDPLIGECRRSPLR